MPVIKNAGGAEAARGACVLDLGDLHRQAEEIVEAAQREAAETVAAGRAEAAGLTSEAAARGHAEGYERGREEGREAGRAEGRREALAAGEAEIAALTRDWASALARWEQQFGVMLLAGQEDVLEFALALARRIVLRVPEVDPRVVQAQVAETLSLVIRPSSLTVAVHPADRSLVDEILPEVRERLATCEHVGIVEDESITRGGCVVRTRDGMIDARIEKQLERIVQTLLPGPAGAAPGEGEPPAAS